MTLSALHTALIREQTEPIAQRLDALLVVQQDINRVVREIRDGMTPKVPTDPDPLDPPSTPPVPTSVVRAVYNSNVPADALAHDRWFGRGLVAVQIHTESGDWVKNPSISWFITELFGNTDRRIFWSLPLMPKNSSLAEVAAGKWDDYFRRNAQLLAQTHAGVIDVRTGWEMNGDWFHWNAIKNPDDFIAAFRRFVTVYRSVSDRFRIEWCPNIGTQGIDPERCYPGDEYVDVVGIDWYYKPAGQGDAAAGFSDSTDPVAAWNRMVSMPRGLQWHRDFALARNKPVAFAEWGVMGDNAGPIIRLFAEWIASAPTPVIYQNFWDHDAAYQGKLSGGRWPATGAAYKAAFA